MMRILMITSRYPGPDVPKTDTPVVHYFVKEWVKAGYDVRVIHTANYFPRLYYAVPKVVRDYIASKKGFGLPGKRLDKEADYCMDGVKVHRVPMKKYIPSGAFPPLVMRKAEQDILAYLKKEDFVPEYAIGHWVMPQAQLLYFLKKKFGCPVTLTLHDGGEQFRHCPDRQMLMDNIDVWGYRSERIRESFESQYGKRPQSFRCFSGIPSIYKEGVPVRTWECVNSFVYVGMLIERKHPDTLINAVHELYGDSDYAISIIGDGGMSHGLRLLAERLNCKNRVNLTGRIERDQIIGYLDQSDVFVMISEYEVFGLVYIEAMARGCIVVASRGEGMQGIIEDGVNGFLCKAGDKEELKMVIERIRTLSAKELKSISEQAQITASHFSDYKVAMDYIENVINKSEAVRRNMPIVGGGGNHEVVILVIGQPSEERRAA